MTGRLMRTLLASMILMLAGLSCKAQEQYITTGLEDSFGLFFSPKGCGLSVVLGTHSPYVHNVVTLRTDDYGVLSGRTKTAGVALSYTHDYSFYEIDYQEFSLSFHAGAGFMLGYVHDFERGLLLKNHPTMHKAMGLTAALEGNVGARLDFKRNVAVDITMSSNPGIHARKDRETGALLLSLYKNGIYQALTPQLSIYYRFR